MSFESRSAGREAGRTRCLELRRVAEVDARVAAGRRTRLLGLAGLERGAAPAALLIPRCRSVHTFGMRFALDLVFLDGQLREVSRRDSVPPRRLAFERSARAVLEIPAATGGLG